MACIKSVPRSALVAFAPDAPYLATGTMAGAVDLSFSSSATLEIFKLDFQSDAYDLPLAGACPSAERFNRLSWGKPESASEDYSLGLVAGGLGDGSISVWNPLKLINSSEDQNSSYVAQLENHTGPVRGLEFSAISPNLLASGADEGELCIWDLANPLESTSYPPLKSAGSGAQTEVSFVSWNPKFQHILASTSYNGMTVVWDLKQQKPVTSFSDSTRRRCSVLQWNPDISTQLIVASDDDSSPSLRVWDVRKTISPIREFVGHTKGVIAMSWCPYDSSFLLTCAKDNRTICWDTVAGEIVCELPASTNWNFDVHWYPKIPGVISASSFDVKVGIYNIQACDKLAVGEREVTTPARLRAPKWLKRPVGVSFGFGGKLISFHPGLPAAGAPPGAPTSSEVYVQNLVTEHSLVSRSNEFEAAIQDGAKSSLQLLCEKKSQDSVSEDEKETWGFLKVMFEKERRKRLLTHLGFSVPNEGFDNAIDEIGRKLASTNSFNERGSNGAVRVGEEDAAFLIDKGEEFFNNPQPSVDNVAIEDNEVANNKQTKKAPEQQLESIDPSVDESIQRALVVGDYKGAVLQSIAANRIADALVIAHVGGPSLWEITRDQYLKSSPSPYIKVVSALVTKDLKGLVSTRPLNLWKETLALLCTLSQGDEWSVHCDTLASRLMAVGNTLAATLCYICAENIEKTVEIWSHSLKTEYDGRTFVDLLQDLMEKTIVLALATGQKRFSASLSKLVENYAELLVSQGLLSTAIEYLQLLGSEGLSHEFATLRDRIEVSAAEKEASQTLPYNNSLQQPDSLYAAQNSSFDVAYHQPVVHPDGGYQQTPAFQMAQPQQVQSLMYVPSQRQQVQPPIYSSLPQQVQQFNFSAAPVPQPAVRSFTPATPSKKVGQFQPSTLASQLYPGAHNDIHQHGPVDFPPGRPLSTFSDKGLIPAIAPQSFVPRSTANPAQPSSPTQLAQLQSVVTPPPPPPTVQTVDTSKVPAELRAVITTLTRLYHETSAAVGGPHANPSKKREIEDNSKRIGALYAKLNSGDISPNAASKLSELCQALDAGDFGGALHIQDHKEL